MLDGPVGPTKSNHVRQPSTRNNRTKPPMPDRDELESRFIKVLVSGNAEFAGFLCLQTHILFIGRTGYVKRRYKYHFDWIR